MGLSPAEFRKAFPNEASCAIYLFDRRWPAGFTCPVCGGKRYAWLNSRAYTCECLDCGRQTSIVAGTVMHRTRLPLTLWFRAAHLIVSHPKTLSVVRFGTILGISYKTAWLLMQKLRRPIGTANSAPLEGIVEVGHTEIQVRGSDRLPGPGKSARITIAAALDVTFYQVRLGEISRRVRNIN
jgi:Zn ribbon nucleic-acid-binding protein